jgi:zinc/manganese transport system ATP-binding protein
MTSERLSELYGTPIDVLRVRDRFVVVGAPDSATSEPSMSHHHDHDHGHSHGGLL